MYNEYKADITELQSKTFKEYFGLSPSTLTIDDITNKRTNVIVRTPNFPQNFTKIIQDEKDEWQMSGELNFGVSYGIIFGEMELEKPEGNGIVYPHFGIALHISGGTTQDFENGGLTGNLNAGFSVLMLNYVNFFIGYDFLNKSGLIGLGARVDMVQFGGFGSDIINKENVFRNLSCQ